MAEKLVMVIFLQLCLFCIAAILRGRHLTGKHLKPDAGSNQLHYLKKRRGKILAHHIGLAQNNGIPFIIRSERWYHRLFKALGIASEIKVSNREFDRRYFIITDYPTHLERALASGQLLSLLQELFTLSVTSLHATPNKIWCVIKKSSSHLPKADYAKHTELLTKISEQNIKLNSAAQNRNLGLSAFLFICVHAGLLTVGIMGVLPTLTDSVEMLDKEEWIVKGMAAGFFAGIGWLCAILALFRKSSWICWVLTDFILCGIVGFFLSGIFFMREANHYLPQQVQVFEKPVTHRTCTLRCKQDCGRRCTRHSSYAFDTEEKCIPKFREHTYWQKQQTDDICRSNAWYEYTIGIPHWRNAPDYSFEAKEELFEQTREGTVLAVPVNKGGVGLEWLDTGEIRVK